MEFEITWQVCLPEGDDVSRTRLRVPRSRSLRTSGQYLCQFQKPWKAMEDFVHPVEGMKVMGRLQNLMSTSRLKDVSTLYWSAYKTWHTWDNFEIMRHIFSPERGGVLGTKLLVSRSRSLLHVGVRNLWKLHNWLRVRILKLHGRVFHLSYSGVHGKKIRSPFC